jgi:hypothetical protein
MRRVLASLLVLGAASQAHAASLTYVGSLAFQFATLPPVVITGDGTAVLNSSAGGSHLTTLGIAPGDFATTGLSRTFGSTFFPILGLQLTASNDTGTFVPPGGLMQIHGVAKLCLFGSCPTAVTNLSLTLSGVGRGGFGAVTGAINVTVIGAPWTTGTAAVGTATAMGFVHGPGSDTSSTANASGAIQLVTPIFVSTNLDSAPVLPSFGILTLHFVPEPGTLMLLGSGIAGFGLFGRSRRH